MIDGRVAVSDYGTDYESRNAKQKVASQAVRTPTLICGVGIAVDVHNQHARERNICHEVG